MSSDFVITSNPPIKEVYGLDKVTGRAKYGADFNVPNMLYAAVLRSPHAHARIIKIDTSKAEALSGVKAFVTRADFPDGLKGENFYLQDLYLIQVYLDSYHITIFEPVVHLLL